MVTDLLQDVRYAARALCRAPLFTAVAVLTVALVIGANTAVFSLLNVLLLRDLPIRTPGNLVQVLWQYPGDPAMNRFSGEQYRLFRDHNTVFSEAFAVAPFQLNSRTPADSQLRGECVTGNYFESLGVSSAAGRVLNRTDDAPGGDPVTVLNWSFWNDRFHRDPAVLGQRVTVAGIPLTIVGVAKKEFAGLTVGYAPQVWLPMAVCESKAPMPFSVVARLKDGVTLDQATAEMRVLDRARIEGMAVRDPQWRSVILNVLPAQNGLATPLHDQFGKPLWVLMAIAGSLLLLAAANLAGIFLARGTSRFREMAIRVSMGASRLRILRLLMTESLLLAIAGAALGVLAAYVGAAALLRVMLSGTRLIGPPPTVDLGLDASVLLFTGLVTTLVAVVSGSVPAWMAFVPTPGRWLRESGSSGLHPRRRRMANGLVVAQVALSLALLTISNLYVQHLWNLRHDRLGFNATSVLLVGLDTAPAALPAAQLRSRLQHAIDRVAELPGVRSVTVSGTSPASGGAASRFVTVDGFDEAPDARRRVMLNGVGPRYFETYRTALLAGREFNSADEAGPAVAIVNEALARHYFAGRRPVGNHLTLERDSAVYEIVGVVADAKYNDIRGAAPPTVYLNCFQRDWVCAELAIRTDVSPLSIAADVRRVVDGTVTHVQIRKLTTLAEQVDAAIVPERMLTALSRIVASAASVLAAMGLYGLLAFAVARRTSEFGIRLALGATPIDITRIVLKNALSVVAVGLAMGIPVALWGTRIASTMLEHLSPEAVRPMLLAGGAMIAVAVLAACVPARRATRVDPLIALRSE